MNEKFSVYKLDPFTGEKTTQELFSGNSLKNAKNLILDIMRKDKNTITNNWIIEKVCNGNSTIVCTSLIENGYFVDFIEDEKV